MNLLTKLSALLLTGMVFLTSCGEKPEPKISAPPNTDDKVTANKQIETKPAPAKTKTPKPTNIAKLNKELAARLIFAEPDEVIGLIKKGATPDAKNRYGLPVIFMAAERGDLTILEALVKAGADVNSKISTSHNTDGIGYTGTADGTPMCYAADKGKVEAMQFLLDNQADVNAAGPEGTTPLMKASQNLQLEAVQWLVSKGSTAGKKKALGFTETFVNPDDKTLKIIQLLK
ncbi:MAG: ankyrin repeat domain-containing protein [Verrucomicrobia bacterium]|nr:ankyrin repeat domain-containing protein [Verrucomicrobiota bacterium]